MIDSDCTTVRDYLVRSQNKKLDQRFIGYQRRLIINSFPYGHVRMYVPKHLRFWGESSVTSNTSCFCRVALIAALPCHFLYNMQNATFGTKGINIIYWRAKCSLANRNRGIYNKKPGVDLSVDHLTLRDQLNKERKVKHQWERMKVSKVSNWSNQSKLACCDQTQYGVGLRLKGNVKVHTKK